MPKEAILCLVLAETTRKKLSIFSHEVKILSTFSHEVKSRVAHELLTRLSHELFKYRVLVVTRS